MTVGARQAAGTEDGYVSPLMARVAGSARLTVEMLLADVPVFQTGLEAAEQSLAETDPVRRAELGRLVQQGQAAQERLVLAALPLIRMLAQKELRRRQQWRSQATFDDLAQEGLIGLLRGLKAYRPDAGHKSPTNYLGQWISTEMRRNAEDLDNDFGVAFDAAERFRRIRALRSRLAMSLRREPTDEEVIAASVDPAYAARSPFAGRGARTPAAPGKPITQDQLDQERDYRLRVGRTTRLGEAAEDAPGLVETAQPLDSQDAGDAAAPVVAEAARRAVAGLMQDTLDLMSLPVAQREIVSRRYGLPPYGKESSARDISRDLNVHRDRVGKVLEAFNEEMARPGGAFHQACGRLGAAELVDLGLGWVLRAMGPVPVTRQDSAGPSLPEALVMPIESKRRKPPPPSLPPAGAGRGTFAQFHCGFHGRAFLGVYGSAAEVPKDRDCPSCGQPSPLLRLMDG